MVGITGPGFPFFKINIVPFVVCHLLTSVRIVDRCYARQVGPDDCWIFIAMISRTGPLETVVGLGLSLISNTSGHLFDFCFTIVNGLGNYIRELESWSENLPADWYEDIGFG